MKIATYKKVPIEGDGFVVCPKGCTAINVRKKGNRTRGLAQCQDCNTKFRPFNTKAKKP